MQLRWNLLKKKKEVLIQNICTQYWVVWFNGQTRTVIQALQEARLAAAALFYGDR